MRAGAARSGDQLALAVLRDEVAGCRKGLEAAAGVPGRAACGLNPPGQG